VIVIGPAATPWALAIVTFPTADPTLGGTPGGAVAVAVPLPAAFEACAVAVAVAGAVEDDAPDEAAGDAGASEDRDEADAVSAEADKDWLPEQPTTARAARTAQAGATRGATTGATFTLNRRAMQSAGAHDYRADVRQRRSRDVDPVRSPY
jgi:hypothetical protein